MEVQDADGAEERDVWEVVAEKSSWSSARPQRTKRLFKKKSRKALAMICLAMEDSQLPLVRSASGAHDAWSRLEEHFEKKSLANKLFLRRRFFTTMMEEGDDVLAHINKLKMLAEQLDAVGAPVSEDDLVITLLGSLSESYQFLITALESRVDTLTWELMTSRLLHEDMKRKEQGGDGVVVGQAFMSSDKKRNGRPMKKTGACNHCGKMGHWIAECPSRIQDNNGNPRQRFQRANVVRDEDLGEYLFSIGEVQGKSSSASRWLIDSGATQHMSHTKVFMKNYKKIDPVNVHLADDGIVQAIGTGDIVMSMKTAGGTKKGVLTNVWHIPKLSRNLFSVGRFTKDVAPVTFNNNGCFVQLKGAKWTIGSRAGKGLFKLNMTPVPVETVNMANVTQDSGVSKSYLWHLRLGHIGYGGLEAIVKKNLADGLDIGSAKQWELCGGCALGKQTRVQFQSATTDRAKTLLEFVHSDVCGPMRTSTFGGMRYFVTFIDDKSRYCAVYLMRNKSEVFDKFVQFVKLAENQTGSRIKVLRSDNGGEYKSTKFAKFCADRGIIQKFTPPYTPRVEWCGRTDEPDTGRVCAVHARTRRLSNEYWGEAVMTAAFLRNRLPTRAQGLRQVPVRSMDEEEAIARQPQGVRLPRVRPRSQGEAVEVGRASKFVPIPRILGPREGISIRRTIDGSSSRESRCAVHGRHVRQRQARTSRQQASRVP